MYISTFEIPVFINFISKRKWDMKNMEDFAVLQKQISLLNKSIQIKQTPFQNICDNLQPLVIKAQYNKESSSVDVMLYAEGGIQNEIYFFEEDPYDFNNARKISSVQIISPGTYYFRSQNTTYNENTQEIKKCWSDWVPYKVFQTNAEIEVDAGEDHAICLGDEIQLNPVIENANQGELLYQAKNTDDFQQWIPVNTTNTNPWNLNSNSNLAGGSSPEIRYKWVAGSTEIVGNWISYGPIDATNSQNTELNFKHFADHYSSNYDYQLKVETSIDNSIWNSTSFNISPQADIGPQNITVDLSNLDGDQFYIRFGITGYEFGIYYWHIDDIKISGSEIETAVYTWTADIGQDPVPNDILNPIVSPTETTTYTLTVTYGDIEVSEEVTIFVNECLEDYEVCANELLNLNDALPPEVDSNDVTWYEDDNGEPSTPLSNPENVLSGTYWAEYDGSLKIINVHFLFTEDCLDCIEVVDNIEIEQSGLSQQWSPTASDYGVLDFYHIENGFKIRFNGIQIFLLSNFMYFQNSSNPNVRFVEDGIWGEEDIPMISELEGSPDQPILRIVFGSNGVEGFYGSRVSSTNSEYELEPLELFNGESFNPDIIWYNPDMIPITVNTVNIGHSLHYSFRSINLQECMENPESSSEVFINPQIKQRVENE